MQKLAQNLFFLIVILILAASVLPGCSGNQIDTIHMMAMDKMPADVRSAPALVQDAYRFAAANPDVIKAVPCYCGCGSIGHTSNYSCYVAGENADGSLQFDNHALGCSICVDITLDSMRLLKQRKTVPEIRAIIDNTYSKYGTSNMSQE